MIVDEEVHNHLERPWSEYENVGVFERVQALVTGNAVIRGGITVKPHVLKFATDLQKFLGGSQNYGTYPGHSPPEGPTQAIDHFNTISSAGWAQQDKAASWAIIHAREYGLRYVIKRGEIWNIERASEGWRRMTLTGNPTADHMDHNHYTLYAKGGVIVEPKPEIGVNDMKVRYIWGPDGLHRTDWVFDGPSRIFAQVGVIGVLNACDKNGFPELGLVDDQTHSWFRDVAAGWHNG